MDASNPQDLALMQWQYVETALWSSVGGPEGETEMDSLHSSEDFAPEARAAMDRQCEAFAQANAADLADMEAEQAGHDFWLTRNGHGAGFWDRGLGELGERLTKAAEAAGESDIYTGDDGLVYVYPS